MTKKKSRFEELNELPLEELNDLFEFSALKAEQKAENRLAYDVGVEFGTKHPEFNRNYAGLLCDYVETMGWPTTLESLERAYLKLQQEGL